MKPTKPTKPILTVKEKLDMKPSSGFVSHSKRFSDNLKNFAVALPGPGVQFILFRPTMKPIHLPVPPSTLSTDDKCINLTVRIISCLSVQKSCSLRFCFGCGCWAGMAGWDPRRDRSKSVMVAGS